MVKLILIAADTIIFMNTNLVTYLISDLAVNPCDASDKYYFGKSYVYATPMTTSTVTLRMDTHH